jgi:hypothetical protein
MIDETKVEPEYAEEVALEPTAPRRHADADELRSPIIVTMKPDERSRTPDKSAIWTAECVVDGRQFTAQSRNGASCELARVLVAAGIADRPMVVYQGSLSFTWKSFHAAARQTYKEGTQPLRHDSYRKFRGRR